MRLRHTAKPSRPLGWLCNTLYYAGAGIVVAALFLVVDLGQISAETRGFYLFGLLVLPCDVGLWPLILWRWLALERERAAGRVEE